MLIGSRFGLWPGHLYVKSGLVEGWYLWAYLFASFGGDPLICFVRVWARVREGEMSGFDLFTILILVVLKSDL